MQSRWRDTLRSTLSLVTALGVALLGATASAQTPEGENTELRRLLDELEARPAEQQDLRLPLYRVQVDAPGENALKTTWKDGLWFVNDDLQIRIGGRIHTDLTTTSANGDLRAFLGDDVDEGSEFRRARIFISGKMDEKMEFKMQYDFAGSDPDYKDVFVRFLDIPGIDNVTIGHFKEFASLEELTSSNYITFTERSVMNSLVPGRSTGVGISGAIHDQNTTWAVGAFRSRDNTFGADKSGSDNWALTGRVTRVVHEENDGEELLHVGAWWSGLSIDNDTFRVSSRPEAHIPQKFVDTGTFPVDDANLYGLEAAWVSGPFSLQGELAILDVDGSGAASPKFSGHYIQASYFLTGEHRPYNKSTGSFTGVVPLDPVIGSEGKRGGMGAWELATRYSILDLTDGGITGGKIEDWTLGVNWHLSRYSRIMLNFTRSSLDEGADGDADIVTLRFQTNF